jgi:hypothetical protein
VAKGSITSFVCDPTTNGFSAAVNETDYVLDQAGHQVTELGSGLNGSMAWAHTNVWAGGQLLATYSAVQDANGQADGALHFYLNDWLGTRRVQTDYAGIQEHDCSSLPFGDQLNCTQSGQCSRRPLRRGRLDRQQGEPEPLRYTGAQRNRFRTPLAKRLWLTVFC